MAADVGLGKTIMALEHARRHDVTRLVVIAPASKVRTGDWQREVERFFDSYSSDTMPVEQFNKEYGHNISGVNTVKVHTLRNRPECEVVSYEMFAKRFKEFLDPNVTLIIDECHFICNATARRSKAILKVAQQAHQWIGLSATPLPNGWRSAETYAVLTRLVRNKTEFVTRFVIIDRSKGFPLILGYREYETLNRWWASIAKPLIRTGDLQLPSRSIAIEPPLTATLLKTYKKAIKERVYGEELLDSPSKLFATLRQIPTPARIEALHSVLDSTDEHVVIFYNFNSERDAILELLAKSFKERKTYEQSGHASELPPRDKWSNLQPSVTLVQYQSGSQAIELTYASVTVYFSPCTSFANYEQSKGRTRRNGQQKTTLFYHIAAENTLDRHIWSILSKKRDFSTDLMNKVINNY